MSQFILIAITGFFASLVDGGLGMGFATISASLLLWIGLSTAAMSAAVNLAQGVTALFSAIAHIRMGNINYKIVKHLVITGMPGGILGAIIATRYQNVPSLKIFIAITLLVMGALIIKKTLEKPLDHPPVPGEFLLPRVRQLWPIGFFGGFFSALAGSWGPVVVAPLLMVKSQPRKTVGSVNTAEFFIRMINVVSFFFLLKTIDLTVSIPLIIGGVVAAPFAVYTMKKIPPRLVGLGVGIIIIGLSLVTILKAIF